MNLVVATILAVSLHATADTVPRTTITLTMVAVQATNEGRPSKYFGPGLEGVRRAVAPLDYDSFYRVKSSSGRAHYGEETKFFITDKYTLYVTPESQDRDGRVRMRVRITMPSRTGGGATLKALDTTINIAPGRHLNLGGLRLGEGELIVVLSVN